MFFTAPMRYIKLIILDKDFQKTIDLLADFGWIEIKKNEEEKNLNLLSINEKIDKIEGIISEIHDFFDIKKSQKDGNLTDLEKIEEYFNNLFLKIKSYKEEIISLKEKKFELEKSINEIEQYKDLNITKNELDKFNFIHYTIGSSSQSDIEKLKNNMKGRLLYVEISKDLYLLITSKKGKWTLDSELKKINYKERSLNIENFLLPKKIYNKLTEESNILNNKLNKLNHIKKDILKKEFKLITKMTENFNLQKVYLDIFKKINHSGSTTIIEGWILKEKVVTMTEKLKEILGPCLAIVTYKPEEIEDVQKGKIKVPVNINNYWIFKPFEELIFNYGAPKYGTLDPTVIFAVTFLFLFGFMFGDIGQGLTIFLIGLILKIKKTKKLQNIAKIMQYAGISAMIFGYIYGSIFCFEQIHQIFTPINSFLFNLNRPYIINTSLTSGFDVVFNLVFITIGIGLFMNLFGILINIINNFLHNKYQEALFSRNGISGFILLLSIIILFINSLTFKFNINVFFLYLILLSIILILLKEPLYNIITHHKPLFHGGVGFWILHSIVELIEIILVTISNNLSFIRVSAFAITHALLSYIIIEISLKIGFFGFLIIIIGNAIIIGLEGLIVSIQTLRLEYYEFFSKFFVDKGIKFLPFKIEKNK
ncbi:MAG: hypothetical protein JXB50_03205 [Spirochaetes bacterium]|nr:hypothetical protein [Spirochaetota bacterium]